MEANYGANGMASSEAVDRRRERGLALLQTKRDKIRRIADETYLAPSQFGSGGYIVDLVAGSCGCPDWEEHQANRAAGAAPHRCKHLWMLRLHFEVRDLPNGSAVEENKKKYVRPPRDRKEKDRTATEAQLNEAKTFRRLLWDITENVPEPEHTTGRPPVPRREVLRAGGLMIYSGHSSRRARGGEIQQACDLGLLARPHAYNTMLRRLKDPAFEPILLGLIEKSATPLCAVERTFAIDSTGIGTTTYGRWYDAKYGEERDIKDFLKLHAVTGTETGTMCVVKVTSGYSGDAPELPALVARAAANGFKLETVCGDKAYGYPDYTEAVESVGARPIMKIRAGVDREKGPESWLRLTRYMREFPEDFAAIYHRRSTIESAFARFDRLVRKSVRARIFQAQVNETLAKVLTYNLLVLVRAIYDCNIPERIWLPRAA